MNKLSNTALSNYLTDNELVALLDGTANSRYSKVKRLLADGKLIRIRRGLYCLTEALGHSEKPHPFELAQSIYYPSYISLESALSFHNLIPEAVYAITSVCTKRAKVFHTPLGRFTYQHLPPENFYTEVTFIKQDHFQCLLAKPWKAICDYIYCYKKEWDSLDLLLENLRIAEEDLPTLRYEEMQILMNYYHHKRITTFLKGVQREFKI